MRPPTDHELAKLHRVEMTSTAPWSRTALATKVEGELVAEFHISISLTGNDSDHNDERVVQE